MKESRKRMEEREIEKKINGYIIKKIYEVSVTWSNYDTTSQLCDKSFKHEGLGEEWEVILCLKDLSHSWEVVS